MRSLILALLLCVLPTGLNAAPVTVSVADPYLELHTGPGRGYPITHVVARGEEISVLKRRTDWFKIRDDRGREGWAHRAQMATTLTPAGTALAINDPSRDQFGEHQREVGAGYFDKIATTVDPTSSTTALAGSTEEGQFH